MNEQATELDAANPDLEIILLRQRADMMGLSYHPSIKTETLRKKIQDVLDGKAASKVKVHADDYEDDAEAAAPKQETVQQVRERVRAEGLRLVRCKIYNLNPQKNDLPGEFITVANKYLGTVTKMIPFGEATDGGYHIPNCIFLNLKERRFQSITTKKGKDGKLEVVRRMVPEYNVEVLDQLTPEEIMELGLKQDAAARMAS